MGEMRRVLTCDEAPEEPATVSTEQVLKIECNISITTNFMLTGIMNVRSASFFPGFPLPFYYSPLTQKSKKTHRHWVDKRYTAKNHD